MGYIDLWYGGKPVLLTYSTDSTQLSLTGDIANINFSLSLGRAISGTVSRPGGGAPPGCQVMAQGPKGSTLWFTPAADGAYRVSGLPAASYTVRTRNTGGYVDEWYSDLSVLGNSSSSPTPVQVTATQDATNINFSFVLGRTISGKVTDRPNGSPISG